MIRRGGESLRLLALCNFNFQIWCEFETWPTDNFLQNKTIYETISFPAGTQRPNYMLQISLWDVLEHSKLKEYEITNFLVFNRHIW